MPTYEYVCESCDHQFEQFQSMNDDPLEECPKCGGAVRRLISGGAGLVFKGSGFYVTDSRQSNSSGGAPSCGRDGVCGQESCPAKD